MMSAAHTVDRGFFGLITAFEVEAYHQLSAGGFVFPYFRLSDGERVLSWRGFYRALGGSNPGPRRGELPAFLQAENLRPFVGARLRMALRASPVFAARPGAGGGTFVGYGIPLSILREVCGVWVEAERAGALHHGQRHVAVRARRVARALDLGRVRLAATSGAKGANHGS